MSTEIEAFQAKFMDAAFGLTAWETATIVGTCTLGSYWRGCSKGYTARGVAKEWSLATQKQIIQKLKRAKRKIVAKKKKRRKAKKKSTTKTKAKKKKAAKKKAVVESSEQPPKKATVETPKQLDKALDEYFGTYTTAGDKAFVAVVRQFCLRQLRANEKGCIHNAGLYAGSDMYYYCNHCKALCAQLSEAHTCVVTLICGTCDQMPHGYLSQAKAVAKEIGIVLNPPWIGKPKVPQGGGFTLLR